MSNDNRLQSLSGAAGADRDLAGTKRTFHSRHTGLMGLCQCLDLTTAKQFSPAQGGKTFLKLTSKTSMSCKPDLLGLPY